MKHTQGKWEIEYGSYSVFVNKEHKKDITDGVVCRMHLGVKNYENAEANAKLIVCAPEMLEMLKDILSGMNSENFEVTGDEIEALIQKATS